MFKLPQNLINNKLNFILLGVIALLIVGGFFASRAVIARFSPSEPIKEIDLSFDPEGPYALLYPRRDGNALILNIKRTASYDQIKYDLVYNALGIDRAASGEINTKEKKGEYEQEILFGSCSTGGKCVYDEGVENGTLTLHIRRGRQAFRMITQWRLQQPDVALGVLTSGDNHLTYNISTNSADLALIKYTIIHDLTGAPKLPSDKEILGKVYSINTPLAKVLSPGLLTIELVENPPETGKIARFDESSNSWILCETETSSNKISASLETGGIFATFVPRT